MNFFDKIILKIMKIVSKISMYNESRLCRKYYQSILVNDLLERESSDELDDLSYDILRPGYKYLDGYELRKHLYLIPTPSKWPLFTSLGVLLSFLGLFSVLRDVSFFVFTPNMLFFFGLVFLLYCMQGWFKDLIKEANQGRHTLVVRQGIQHGFVLFLVTEVMLFFGFFWAFLHCACGPSVWLGGTYPPIGITPVDPYGVPLLNTCLLITSGLYLTISHKTISIRFERKVIKNWLICIFLGILFLINQILEYSETPFSFFDSIYGSSFYMLTGLHGFHVIVGLIFLIVGLVRFLQGHFTSNHYLGFVLAIWYWHFVDIIWIMLYFIVYYWFC